MALEKFTRHVNESAKGTRDFYRDMSQRTKEKKELNTAIKDHKKEMEKIGDKRWKDTKKLDEQFVEEVKKNPLDAKKGSEKREKYLEQRLELSEDQKEEREGSSESFKDKQAKTENKALRARLREIKLEDANKGKDRTWKQWNAKCRREILEGRNKKMIGQLESYGLENDRSLRNVSDLTHEDVKKYIEDRKDEEKTLRSEDHAMKDLLKRHKEWQEGKEFQEDTAFSKLVKEVRGREKGDSSLYNNIKWNDSGITLLDSDTDYSRIIDDKRSKRLEKDDGYKSRGGYLILAFRSIHGDRVNQEIQRARRDLSEQLGKEMDAHPDKHEKIIERLEENFHVLNERELINYKNKTDRKRDWQRNVRESIDNSRMREDRIKMEISDLNPNWFSKDSRGRDTQWTKWAWLKARQGIEETWRGGLRRLDASKGKEIEKRDNKYTSEFKKFDKSIGEELDSLKEKFKGHEDKIDQLKKDEDFLKVFGDLKKPPSYGPEYGDPNGQRNNFKPTRWEIKKLAGGPAADEFAQQSVREQFRGMQDSWRNIGVHEHRLHTQRDGEQLEFNGQRRPTLESYLSAKFNNDVNEGDVKKMIDKLNDRRRKVEVDLDRRIQLEVKDGYTSFQETDVAKGIMAKPYKAYEDRKLKEYKYQGVGDNTGLEANKGLDTAGNGQQGINTFGNGQQGDKNKQKSKTEQFNSTLADATDKLLKGIFALTEV